MKRHLSCCLLVLLLAATVRVPADAASPRALSPEKGSLLEKKEPPRAERPRQAISYSEYVRLVTGRGITHKSAGAKARKARVAKKAAPAKEAPAAAAPKKEEIVRREEAVTPVPVAEVATGVSQGGTQEAVAKLTRDRVRDIAGTTRDLSGRNLRGLNLAGLDLRGANLGGADLYLAILDGANLEGANLRGASLEMASLKGANLKGAKLAGAGLFKTNLQDANLERADLQGVYAVAANLKGAAMASANLAGALFTNALLDGVDAGRTSRVMASSEEDMPVSGAVVKAGMRTSGEERMSLLTF